MSVQSAYLDASVYKSLLVTVFVRSFGDRVNSPFSSAPFVLRTRDYFCWQSVSALLLQKYVSQLSLKSSYEPVKKKAFVVQPEKNNNKNKNINKNKDLNCVECCYFGTIGHIKAEFYNKKSDKDRNDVEKDRGTERCFLCYK